MPEWEAMVNGDRHTTTLWWILLASQRLGNAGQPLIIDMHARRPV